VEQLDHTKFRGIGQERLCCPIQVFGIANKADVWYTQYQSRITRRISAAASPKVSNSFHTILNHAISREVAMGKILCATRGGEASYRTQDAAIALAKECGDELLFLFVVDTHFLDRAGHAVRPDVVAEEMSHMGEFLLAMAQERAQRHSVAATYLLRRGEFRDELKATACEEGVDLVVLGQPAGTGSAFAPADLEAFAAEIESETGVDTRII
jgi:nucleotide-binding universal stress UspA family protein